MKINLGHYFFAWSALVALTLLAPACRMDCISVEGTGPMTEKNSVIENFTAIEVGIPALVSIRQGETFSLRARGQANILDLIEYRVKDSKLSIEFNQPCVNSNFDSLSFFITLPILTAVEVSGSGKAILESGFQCENLSLDISGSGSINASLQASKKLQGNISGSGSLDLTGSAPEASFDISGSGEIQAFNFQTNKSNISVSGSGSAEVNALENLSVDVSGSGDIFYKGSPKIDSSVSGSGEVKAAN